MSEWRLENARRAGPNRGASLWPGAALPARDADYVEGQELVVAVGRVSGRLGTSRDEGIEVSTIPSPHGRPAECAGPSSQASSPSRKGSLGNR